MALALPINIEDILRKQKIESNRIEFKEGWNPNKIYHTICAFANDFDNIGGGYIIVGVEEENGIAKRPVKGIPLEQLDRIQKDMVGFNNKIEPYYLPRTSVEEVDEKYILVIWVPAGVNRPYEVRENVTSKSPSLSKAYVRTGTSSIEAKGAILDEIREMANRTPFDDRGNMDISVDDISPVLVLDYLRRVKSKFACILKGNTAMNYLMIRIFFIILLKVRKENFLHVPLKRESRFTLYKPGNNVKKFQQTCIHTYLDIRELPTGLKKSTVYLLYQNY